MANKEVLNEGFTQVKNKLIKMKGIDCFEKMILIYFLSYGENIYPSITRICEDLEFSRSTCIRKIKSLQEKGFLEITKNKSLNGDYDNNSYKVVSDLNYPVSKKDYLVSDLNYSSIKNILQVVSELDSNNTNKKILNNNINNIYSPLKNELYYEEENKSLEKDLLKQVDNSLNIKNETDVIAKKNVKLTQFKWKSKEYEEAFKEIWAIYPNKRGIANAKKSINKLLDHYSKDELMRAVKRYDSECKGKEIKYIKIGSTFFNSGYEDYLDENYISLDTSSTKKEYKPKSDNFD